MLKSVSTDSQEKMSRLAYRMLLGEIAADAAAAECSDEEQILMLCEIERIAGMLADECRSRGLPVPDRPPFKLPKPI